MKNVVKVCTGLYRQRGQCYKRMNEDTGCPLDVKLELVALCDSWWVVG